MPRAHPTPSFDAQRFLITYAQCNGVQFSCDSIADYINGKDPTPEYVEVGRELHADGGTHFHVYVAFPSRFRGNMFAFDFHGKHPNVRTVKRGANHTQRAREYIRKEGLELCSRGVPAPFSAEGKCDPWSAALTQPDAESFLAHMRDKCPKEYILRYHDLVAFAQFHFNAPSDYVSPYDTDSFVVPAEVNEWITDVFGEVCLTPGDPDAPF